MTGWVFTVRLFHSRHLTGLSRRFFRCYSEAWEQISDELKDGRLQDGLACRFERYGAARDFAEACRRQFADTGAPYDVLRTAAVTGEAPLGWHTGNASMG